MKLVRRFLTKTKILWVFVMSSLNNTLQRYRSSVFPLAFHIFIIISIMQKPASAESPSIEKTILIKTDSDAPINPRVLVRSNDGGFIVGGTADSKAWAAKLDSEGHDVWRYYAKQEPTRYVGLPEFRGIAPMADGSFYLCGVAPRQTGSDQPASFVTHLDADGRALSEKLMVPVDQLPNVRNLSSFDTCERWGDGVVLLGNLMTVIRPGAKNITPIAKTYYWIVAIDSTGKTKWEKLVEFSFGAFSVVVSQYVSLIVSDSTLLFSVTNSNYTDILAIDADGNLRDRTEIKGFFRLIKPTIKNDSLIQLWGGIPDSGLTSIIDLDSSLNETNRVDNSSDGYATQFIFRMPDKSLVSFGTGEHWIGGYRAEGIRVDKLFRKNQTINLEKESVEDAGQIGVAAQGNKDSQFIVAKSVMTRAVRADSAGRTGESAEFKRGLSIEFVNF